MDWPGVIGTKRLRLVPPAQKTLMRAKSPAADYRVPGIDRIRRH
jgi:hypothetical protein